MAAERARTAGQALTESTFLLQCQLAAMEAARAVWEIVGEEHSGNFVVIGGGALLFHGFSFMMSKIVTKQGYGFT